VNYSFKNNMLVLYTRDVMWIKEHLNPNGEHCPLVFQLLTAFLPDAMVEGSWLSDFWSSWNSLFETI